MSSPCEIGKSISESVLFVSRVAAECESLAKLIKEEISKLLLSPEISNCYRAKRDWGDVYEVDDSGWINTGLGTSLPLFIGRKHSPCGYLFFQISLTGFGIEAASNEPLLHVGWWSSPLDFDGVQMSFPLDLDAGYEVTLEEERLFRWSAPGLESEWCYSLRLTDINSPADVQINVLNPIKGLLLGNGVAQALSGTVAVRYIRTQDDSGQYQVLPR